MTKPDPLKAFFDADEAPAVDPGFRMAVMERVARRRLQLGLARAAVAGLVVFAALLLLRPVMVGLLVLLSGAFLEAMLMLGATALAAFAAYCLATDRVGLPRWAQRLL
ncbi:hypothetical protein [Maricaulis sp.]|uniref:hypothetical protein n=1 Tax=Maricaulis sp. TaxID=1486257 RepID=UPI003A924721